MRLGRRRYYEKKLENAKSNTHATWKILNKVLNRKKSRPQLNTIFKSAEGQEISDPVGVANRFCSYFSSIGHNWEYVYKYWRDSANDEYRRHEKLGGSGGMLPLGNFENLSSLGCNLNNLANTRISNCGQQSEKEKLDDFYYLSKKLIKLEYPRRKS